MTDLDVFIDPIDTAGSPRRVGTAHITRLRGRVSTTFLLTPAISRKAKPASTPRRGHPRSLPVATPRSS